MLYVKRAQEIQKTVIAYNSSYLTFNRLMILFSFHFSFLSLFFKCGEWGGEDRGRLREIKEKKSKNWKIEREQTCMRKLITLLLCSRESNQSF